MGTTQWDLDETMGTSVLVRSKYAVGRVGFNDGKNLVHGLYKSLEDVEALATTARLSQWVPYSSIELGNKLSWVAKNDGDPTFRAVKKLYMSAHQNAARVHSDVLDKNNATKVDFLSAGQQAAPLLIPLVVFGVAAICGVAWYATSTQTKSIEVNGSLLQSQSKISALSQLAMAQLVATGQIQPDLVAAIEGSGKEWSNPTPIVSYVLLGGGIVALAATGGYAYWQSKKR